jgi:hypothetical protein
MLLSHRPRWHLAQVMSLGMGWSSPSVNSRCFIYSVLVAHALNKQGSMYTNVWQTYTPSGETSYHLLVMPTTFPPTNNAGSICRMSATNRGRTTCTKTPNKLARVRGSLAGFFFFFQVLKFQMNFYQNLGIGLLIFLARHLLECY